uniref:Uncharacterized protein n=1 Tax=Panagrolaimus sp. ES5 TaxID=591445 RepID=A0AC34GUX4_9BILA
MSYVENGGQKWHFTFAPDLRGFIIFDEKFVLNPGETVLVYRMDGSLQKYFLANYTSETKNSTSTSKYQRITGEKGEGLTVEYTYVSPFFTPTTPSTTISTETTTVPSTATIPTTTVASTTPATGPTTMPPTFMFLVSSFNETASLMNNTQDSGIWDTPNITNTLVQTIATHGNVTQIWHYYPASQNIRLSFALIHSTALENDVGATLTLYRGDANDLSNTSTIIYVFNSSSNLGEAYTYGGDYGQPLSLLYDYPLNETIDGRVYGFNFMVSVLILNSTDSATFVPPTPITDPSGNPITATTPTPLPPSTSAVTVIVTDGNGNNVTDSSHHPVTVTVPITVVPTTTTAPTTTTSGAAPFIFSLAPIIISLILQKCQAL